MQVLQIIIPCRVMMQIRINREKHLVQSLHRVAMHCIDRNYEGLRSLELRCFSMSPND